MKVFVGNSAENFSSAEKSSSNWRKHAEVIGPAKSTVEKYPHMLDPRSRGSGERILGGFTRFLLVVQ
jgi:hypothetical protein